MKAGIISADAVTTVSPRYASETLMPEYGFGLEGVLAEKGKAYKGILNGVDYSSWNPSDDALLQATYDRNSLQGKQLCKMSLVEQCG
ncbi:MAG: glycogen synthase, partial [Gammaproteobacteria bacterium]|nr:glycogen synthase [Gammaproteobacteria bacterium]